MLYSELGCGWDPNDKQVEPAGYGTMGAVPMSTQQLTYTIHFQNTGSGQAFNVILRDRLSDDLDPSTIEMLAWSHAPSSIVIEADGELAVRFDGIHLPDSGSNRLGSNGYIKFRVGIVAGTTPSTEIDNTAEIYFDNQTGVLTNVTVNTLTDCSTWMPVINEPVSGALEATEGDNYQWYMDGSPLPDDTARTLLVPYPGSFTVMVASHLGCSALSDPYQVIGTGTPGPGGAVIAVFPVPFTVQARVVMDRPLTNAHKIDLIDACGRVLRSWHGDGRKEMTIDRAGLASGLYLLRVSIADALVAACRVMVE